MTIQWLELALSNRPNWGDAPAPMLGNGSKSSFQNIAFFRMQDNSVQEHSNHGCYTPCQNLLQSTVTAILMFLLSVPSGISTKP
jgi:hypothetical protein